MNLELAFARAVSLQPAAGRKFLIADRETALAMSDLLTLVDIDQHDAHFSTEQLAPLSAAAPDQIGPCGVTLNE